MTRSLVAPFQSLLYQIYHLTLVIIPSLANTSPHCPGTIFFCIFFYILLFLQYFRQDPVSGLVQLVPFAGKALLQISAWLVPSSHPINSFLIALLKITLPPLISLISCLPNLYHHLTFYMCYMALSVSLYQHVCSIRARIFIYFAQC